MNLYWGDLHSHCAISYGHGTVEQAVARARQQLDFCSITGHAFWPDMPTNRDQYAEIIDYHHRGFATLAGNWGTLLEQQAAATTEHEFIAFPSYEWHSLAHGDHNVYGCEADLSLLDASDVAGLRELLAGSPRIAIPHHIGYKAGYRGINWDTYAEAHSPFVEIFSLHGCSLSEDASYPMLHDMGPRDFGSTAEAGWQRGFQFGIVGGTDHHGAYPGSHGDGRMAVLARDLTRASLWEAFTDRRVYALTGDNIEAHCEVEGAPIGAVIQHPSQRTIQIRVNGLDALHTIELRKNGRPFKTWAPLVQDPISENDYRLRLTWGWGRKSETCQWDIALELDDGTIRAIDPLFSGQAIVAPQDEETGLQVEEALCPHEVVDSTERSLQIRSITQGNLTMRHATTQGASLLIHGSPTTTLTVRANGEQYRYQLSELLRRGHSHFLRGWLTEAIRIGPLTPVADCRFSAETTDTPTNSTDRYQLNVSQRNGQWAWLTPIWVQQ